MTVQSYYDKEVFELMKQPLGELLIFIYIVSNRSLNC